MGAPARLIDLSVARPPRTRRRLRHPIGTDAYMSPEQCDPGARTGVGPAPASDVWGLGATLFHAVAGYRRRSSTATPTRTTSTPVPAARGRALRAARRRAGRGRGDGPRRASRRDPDDRPLPHEVAEALEPVLAGLPRGSLTAFNPRA